MKRTQQFVQRDLLLCRAIVLILSVERWLVLAMSSFVAHSDAICIVSFDVTSSDAKWATVVKRTVTTHIEVITRVLAEATGPVACGKFL